MNTIIHSIEFVKHTNGIIYPKDDTMFVQTTIAGESFDRMLIANEYVINIFFWKNVLSSAGQLSMDLYAGAS